MGSIVIHPYAAALPTGIYNAKNYPYFPEVVKELKQRGHEITQIGVGEPRIEGVDKYLNKFPLRLLKELVVKADVYIAVDSFLPHFAHIECNQKRGVVLWGKSDHRIWGHPENENLFVDESHFRQWQFQDWHNEPHDPSAFVPPKQVIWAVERILHASHTPSRPAERLVAVSRISELAAT